MDTDTVKRFKYKFWPVYTCAFCVTALIAFFPFLKEGRTFIWYSDAQGQYLPNMLYLFRNLADGIKNFLFDSGAAAFPGFDFSSGVGQDVSALYFKGILEYASMLFGTSNIEFAFAFLLIARLYFAGISFAVMALYFKQDERSVVTGALVYAFTGFTIYYGMRHVSFLIPVILLPLLIVGIEKLLHGDSSWLFVLCVFYSAWTDYYFLYMNTIVLGIYVCVRWLDFKSLRRIAGDIKNILLSYCTGIGLGAVSLFPKLYKMFFSNRMGSYTVESRSFLSYGKDWIAQFFARLISPYTTDDYTKYYMLYAVSAIIVPAVVMLFLTRKSKYRKLKLLWIIGTIFFFLPLAAFVFSGFNSMVNRWNYAYTLLLAGIVTAMLPKLKQITATQCMICFAAVFLMCLNSAVNDAVGDRSTQVGTALLLFCSAGVVGAAYCSRTFWRGRYFYQIVAVLVIANICVNVQYIMAEGGGGFLSQFTRPGQVTDTYKNCAYAAAAIEDESFYRVETDQYSQNIANAPRIFGVNGTSIYDSTLPKNSLDYNDRLLNRGQYTINNFYGYDSRSSLEALGNVGYFITGNKSANTVPYGFTPYKEQVCANGSTKYIYKNKYKLPIGYVYDSYLTQTQADELDPLELQDALLQAAVLSDGSKLMQNGKPAKDDLVSSSGEIPYQLQCEDGVSYREGTITVSKGGAALSLFYETAADSEIYLTLSGLNIDRVSDSSFSIQIRTDSLQKGIWAFHSLDKYRPKHYQDYCVHLGYQKTAGETRCRIVFPTAGSYDVDSIKIQAVRMNHFPDCIKRLQQNSLSDVTVSNDCVKGTIQSDKEQILCMSIPYSEFWSVYVDGKKTKAECINYMWTGIPITAGRHSVQLFYTNRALRIGLAVSAATAALIWIWLMYKKQQRGMTKK